MMNIDIDVVGCDVGDRTSELFVIRADGSTERPKAVKTTQEAIAQQLESKRRCRVVIEVGTHSRWISALLKGMGHEVVVANPRRVQLIAKGKWKTDKRDAELLARLGRADVELLAPIQHRSMEAQADLALIKARDAAVSCRTKLVNQVRSMAKSFGVRLPRCSAESFHRNAAVREAVPAELRPALLPQLRLLAEVERAVKAFDQEIGALRHKYPEIAQVSQIRGVGPITAAAFVLTIEEPRRFQNARVAGAYVGLTPRKDQSGMRDAELPITKAGDPLLRKLLLQSANYVLGPFGEDSDLRRWGLKLAARGGKGARGEAKVAVARKLAVLMTRLWITGEVYQPIGYVPAHIAA